MNVLILAPYYAPFDGVGSARMISLSAYLMEQGDAVSVLALDMTAQPRAVLTAATPDGVRVQYVEREPGKQLYSRRYRDAAFALLAKEKFDVCIASVGPYDAMYFAPEISRRFGVPYVIDYRDMWTDMENLSRQYGYWWKQKLLDIYNTPVERRAFRHAAKVVPVTDDMATRLCRRYRMAPERFLTVFNGYDETAFPAAKRSAREQTPVRLVISGKCAYYNVAAGNALLTAVKRLMDEGYALTSEHMGAEEPSMLETARALGILERGYRYLGLLPYEEAVRHILEADVLIQGYSLRCGLGTKVFDYIAADKPIVYIGTRPSELSAFIGQFPGGFTCDADAGEVYGALKTILDEPVTALGCADRTAYSRAKQNLRYREALLCIAASGKETDR